MEEKYSIVFNFNLICKSNCIDWLINQPPKLVFPIVIFNFKIY